MVPEAKNPILLRLVLSVSLYIRLCQCFLNLWCI